MIPLRLDARYPLILAAIACLALGLLSPPAVADELLVADRATSRVLAFDAETGAFTRVVSSSPLLSEPVGLSFGPGGLLYVANLQSDAVRIDPATGAASIFAAGTAGAGGIAYHAASNTVFVSEFGQFNGDDVFQYDAAGNLLRTITTAPPQPTGRTGMTFDAAGNLYVGTFANDQFFSGTVLKFDAAGDFASSSVFASGSGLAGANGLAFDANGDLLVTSLIGQGVVKFDVDGGSVAGGAAFGPPIAYPSGVLAQPNGEVLATSLGNNNPQDPIYGGFLFPGGVFRYTPEGVRTSFLIGDFTADAAVTAADLVAWSAAYGATAAADATGDGATDGADFLAWQRALGRQGVAGSFQPTGLVLYPGPAVAASVPEPAAGALVVLASIAGAGRWRRRPFAE